MKTLQSTVRGRGVGRGQGRGRGRGRGRGAGDPRFAARFRDPRFQLASRGGGGYGNGVSRGGEKSALDAAQSDPRFAKRLREMGKHYAKSESEGDDENEDGLMEDEEQSSQEVGSDFDGVKSEGFSEGEAAQLDDDVAAWSASETEFVEPRRRLAVVNCSWDHIRSVDLYAILFYALPLGGRLIDVAVYMSEFGKRMLEHERVHGPDLWVKKDESGKDIRKMDKKADSATVKEEEEGGNGDEKLSGDDHSGDEEGYSDSDPWEDDDPVMLEEEGEDGELFSEGKHRKYERDRMKYYYAVASFDSPETAEAVYKQLDGMDIEASGVVLDLRYIDDDEVFENPVNRADCIPANYKPLSAFKAAAMSQTRFRISWDQDDIFRHRSLRDSFTGDTAEDDLAAYIAPPDSSDEDEVDDATGNGNRNDKKAKRARERQRIRKKYSALLGEIGGMAIDENDGDEESGEGEEDSGNDDDSLNRFSDVEMEESDDNEDDASEVAGEMEATLDLDAESKATHLQRETRIKQLMKSGTLGSNAELKYKLRRKDMRKSKKEMLMREREAEEAQLHAERDERRQALREVLGTNDEGATHLSGKEKRKKHARDVKRRLAAERVAKKRMRVSNTLGVTHEVQQRLTAETKGVDAIDPRFQSKLLNDPRFHLDVAQKDKRVDAELVNLAATVTNARRAKRQTERVSDGGEGAVDYFLSRPGKRVKR
ncbi:hypothetical protein TRVL_01428 [Trypanosoma vivax]|uniref:ESF1 RRM domain-containing protein n=1 Tax=Trypanosoma vivax (strain Y486) TaxID=1055687 RepID=G0U762_TRYVY|nr:hypothetical protein TRVL_01428 [Trypanosoma vivax]CCC51719.1 conserved hypothetical protein [Trypanosoma vivax Y486]